MSPPQLVIYGAGGHGHVVADAARAEWTILGFLDDDAAHCSADTSDGPQVFPTHHVRAEPGRWREHHFALGVGDNGLREECYRLLKALGLRLVTIVHPSAIVSPSAQLGEGCVVLPRAVVNAGAQVGEGVIINSGAIIEHDCRVERFAHISPGVVLGGGASVGERAHVGLSACVLPKVHVGADARVGAGAVVVTPVLERLTVVGVPARPLVRHAPQPQRIS
ncbi:acetyltransferase [Aggregicoccus sp. 17bor-14]|uniref:acetyltransferase n=1 Tax=Myxococcaceae TaxID=31 RepID=UPI00129D0F1E|nr:MULTISPECIES: acetyltransferase [Myxococcaceae]MBF5043468.1 acetyltransferase [Simulacricoccus sp. 17bor-14]MRI89226.1 acetyltransferase [Aggregicoccus sp. 17bor-14]